MTRRRIVCWVAPLVVAIGCRALFQAGGRVTEGDFSHKFHLKVATDLKCESCHRPLDAPDAPPGKYMSLTELNLCAKCHDPTRSSDLKAAMDKFVEPRRVGAFAHAKHAAHTKVECTACHVGVPASDSARAKNVPTMETCWTCHSKNKTTAGESGARCALCHVAEDYRATPEKSKIFSEVIAKNTPPGEVPAAVMPAAHAKLMGDLWHGTIDEDQIPADHTAIFKSTTHGRISQAPTAKCYACHWQKDCTECHETMRPQSHTLRFERSAHGRFAAERSEACATCHQADFCEACHRIPPPGHTPTFRNTGAHARQARLETRSCFTCHQFEEDCARCHNR